MMNSRFYLLAAALVTLAACGNDNEMTDSATTNGELVPLQVTGSINAAKTRITLDNQWKSGDEIGISGVSGNLTYKNYRYRYSTEGGFQPFDSPIYFGGATGMFNAYYPYDRYIKDGKMKISVGEYYDSRDLLYAENADVHKDNPNLALKFDHKMSMLILHMKGGTGFDDSNFDNVFRNDKINFAPVISQVAFDTTNGTVAPDGEMPLAPYSPQSYKEDEGEGYYYRVLLCPAEIKSGLTFYLDKSSFDGNVIYEALLTTNKDKDNPEMVMEPGKVYEYTITVHKTEMIPSNVTISPWEKAWEGSNDVEATV